MLDFMLDSPEELIGNGPGELVANLSNCCSLYGWLLAVRDDEIYGEIRSNWTFSFVRMIGIASSCPSIRISIQIQYLTEPEPAPALGRIDAWGICTTSPYFYFVYDTSTTQYSTVS